jgi:ribose-phosphate pyrophosphokinase
MNSLFLRKSYLYDFELSCKMKAIVINLNHFIGKKIAKKANTNYCKAIIEPFPDNETYLKFPCKIKGRKIFLIVDFAKKANEMMTLVLLASKTLKKLGAEKVFLVAPYMPYLRQDKAFHTREAVSGPIISNFLSKLFDGVITVDPHLHRVKKLSGFFSCKTQKLTATKLIAKKLSKQDCVLLGPDAESKQWIKKIAKEAGKEFAIAKKKRFSSRKVKVVIDKGKVELKEKKVIIVDDIISTGHTIIEAATALKKEKVKNIECYCIHGLFMEKAMEKLKNKGVKPIASNTLENSVVGIDISKEIAEGIKKWC